MEPVNSVNTKHGKSAITEQHPRKQINLSGKNSYHDPIFHSLACDNKNLSRLKMKPDSVKTRPTNRMLKAGSRHWEMPRNEVIEIPRHFCKFYVLGKDRKLDSERAQQILTTPIYKLFHQQSCSMKNETP